MADMRRFQWLDLLLLLLVLAVGGGARAGYLLSCAEGGDSAGPLRVQEARPVVVGEFDQDVRGAPTPSELDVLIDGVQKHLWFGARAPFADHEETTAHVAPGYPWLVGLLGRFVPTEQLDYYVRWIQVGLGALTAGLYYLFARRAFRSLAVGTLAGLFTALHPFWVIGVATIDDGTLAAFALAGCLFLGSQAGEKGGALTSLLLGLSLAGLALVRAALLPFSFVALVWFLLRSRSLPSGWLCGLLAFLGFGIGLGPWTVRNYQMYDEPVPVASSTYLHLWIGNNPDATGGPATEKMWSNAPVEELQKIDNQPARYARLGQEVAREWRESPVESIRRRMWAGLAFVFGHRWFADGSLAEKTSEAPDMPEWLADSYELALHGVLFGMIVLGLIGWRWSYAWRWESIPAALAAMWVPVPYVLSHAGALSGPRLPLDGVLLCFAAFTICCCLPGGGWLREAPDAGEPAPKTTE